MRAALNLPALLSQAARVCAAHAARAVKLAYLRYELRVAQAGHEELSWQMTHGMPAQLSAITSHKRALAEQIASLERGEA
jgi:hypothetical protein